MFSLIKTEGGDQAMAVSDTIALMNLLAVVIFGTISVVVAIMKK